MIVDLTNPNIYKGRVNIPGDTLHIFRSKFLWDGACHERLRVANFGLDSVVFTLTIRLDADFADIFEVRGTKRASRGKRLPSKIDQDSISFIYEGLDKKVRSTTVKLVPIPERIEDSIIIYKLSLKPKNYPQILLISEQKFPSRPAISSVICLGYYLCSFPFHVFC